MVTDSGTNFLVPDVGFMLMALVSMLLPFIVLLVVIWLVVRARQAPITAGYGSAEARLQELAQLQQGGLITPEEYDARRTAILDSI